MKQQYYACIVRETPGVMRAGTSHVVLGRILAVEDILLIRKRPLLHRSMQDKTMHAMNS